VHKVNADKTQLFTVQHVRALYVHPQTAHIVDHWGGLHVMALPAGRAQLNILYPRGWANFWESKQNWFYPHLFCVLCWLLIARVYCTYTVMVVFIFQLVMCDTHPFQ
jgi:hypothetical protein